MGDLDRVDLALNALVSWFLEFDLWAFLSRSSSCLLSSSLCRTFMRDSRRVTEWRVMVQCGTVRYDAV